MALLSVRRLTGTIGAEVRGVDLTRIVDDDAWSELRRLWLEHLVLFFPEQHLAADDHLAFGHRFGIAEVHPFLPKLDEAHQEIVVLDSEQGARVDVFHTDVTFSPTPPMASILQMIVMPECGGDTIWTDQYGAFTALSPVLQDFLAGLTAVHAATTFGRPEVQAVHPVVRVHPETGRPALFVNRTFTERICELSQAESRTLLSLLFDVSEQPFLQCRYSWSEGTVAVWDNRCTQHYAVNDYAGRRVVQRVTINGDVPFGLSAARRRRLVGHDGNPSPSPSKVPSEHAPPPAPRAS